MLTEDQACRILEAAFQRRGYSIVRNVAFAEKDVSFEIDGWDAKARVGFEFLSRAQGDHDDLSSEEMALLIPRLEAGELYLLLIDEAYVADDSELEFAAARFLDEVEHRRGTGRLATQDAAQHAPKDAPEEAPNRTAPSQRARVSSKKPTAAQTKKSTRTRAAKTTNSSKKKKKEKKKKKKNRGQRTTAPKKTRGAKKARASKTTRAAKKKVTAKKKSRGRR